MPSSSSSIPMHTTPMSNTSDSPTSATTSSLYWRDVTITVPSKEKPRRQGGGEAADGKNRTILHSNSGYVHPGELLFIMGPSGSGKSTLLDSLSARRPQGTSSTSGIQFINQSMKSTKDVRRRAKYVQQHDELNGVLTVSETLQINADLYLSLPAVERAQRVDETLAALGLGAHAHTKVGNAFFRGLSGGQKRRVSIGQELVGNPQILFLDEPTSGLDSATAVAMVDELRRIARERHIAMVLTIHQPSERLFELADSFMLLASGGHTCYFGDAGNATYYFQDVLGFTRPPSQSPIEWMLHLVNKDFGGNEKQVDYIINAWRNSDSDSDSNSGPRAALMHTLDGAGLPGDAAAQQQLRKEAANAKYTRSTYAVGMRRQISVLTRRGVLNAMRNPAVLWLRFAMYVILAVSMGLVWLRLGTGADKINATSFAFYIVAYMVFMSVSVLPAYLEERAILIKEQMNGAYSIPAYITAHTIYEIPYMLLLSFVISVIIYFMVGLTTGAKRFFIYFANLFLSLFVAESIMVLLAAALPWLIVAITAGAMIFGLFMCVQGVFIPIDRIGWWLRWAKFIALHFYSYSTYMVNQFEGVTYTKNPALGFPDDINGVDVYNNQGVETRMWVNFVALIVMVFVYRALAAAWLQKFVKST